MEQSLPLGTGTEATWGVGELHDVLSELIEYRFGGPIWITGELRSLSKSTAGHAYFDLIEPGAEGTHGTPRLAVTLFDSQRQWVNTKLVRAGNRVRIEEGTELRIRGHLRTYAPQSRIQFNMTDIDPAYTLGVIGQQREQALAALAAKGLLDRNSSIALRVPATRIALVTSRNSAAAADVLDELRSSSVGFDVLCIDARTQGRDAEESMIAALRTAEAHDVDVVLLVRGGGSSADLAVFDSEVLGSVIAKLSVPVFTGIGHETDSSVADVVAHSAHKTPTAAAAVIVRLAEEQRVRLVSLSASVTSAARGAAARASLALDDQSRSAGIAARKHLAHESALLDIRLERIAASAPRVIDSVATRTESAARQVATASRDLLERRRSDLERLAELIAMRDPRHTMDLGWSVLSRSDGTTVREVTDVSVGEVIRTQLKGGVIISQVSAVESADGPDVLSDQPAES